MTGPVSPWKRSHVASSGDEQEAIDLFKTTRPARPVDAATVARLWTRVGPRVAAGPSPSRAPWRMMAVGALAVGGALFASLWASRESPTPPPVQVAPPPAAPAATVSSVPLLAPVAPATLAGPEGVTGLLPAPAPAAPPARPARMPKPSPRPEAPKESSLREESRMLQAALAALRAGHDAHAALKLLDGYDARFPRGELRSEAALTRLDALLAAGDHPAALKLLGTMDAALSPRATELSVVRAELLAEAGQCAPAVALFRAADVVETPVLLRERSLYGWAICLGKLGDPQGSQARMEEYLARYPGGRFSDAVRQALGE